MNLDLSNQPSIVYPCEWEYRVIGEDQERLREIIAEIMPRKYELKYGKTSSQGRFVSVYVWLIVHNEQERNDIFAQLSHHSEVKMVI